MNDKWQAQMKENGVGQKAIETSGLHRLSELQEYNQRQIPSLSSFKLCLHKEHDQTLSFTVVI